MKTQLFALFALLAGGLLTGCQQPVAENQISNTPSQVEQTPATDQYDESLANKSLTGQKPTEAKPNQKGQEPVEDRKPKDGEEVAVVDTEKGKIILMFFPDKAPNHVKNFIKLAKEKFYDGTKFHRTMPGFMIQGGDPKTKDDSKRAEWGTGGSKENVKAEFNDVHHAIGILSMARSQDPDSASSQFFIMVGDNSGLDGQYSAFGKVVSGQEVADAIVALPSEQGSGAAEQPVTIKSIKIEKWPLKK